MKGKIKEILQIIGGVCRITVEVNKIENADKLQKFIDDKTDCSIEIKKFRVKRSLNSNGYLWVLCEKISEKMGISKDEVYEKMLREYGTIATDSNEEKIIFSIKANIDVSKYFKYYKFLGDSKDLKFKHYYVIKGSSEYDSLEMTRLLKGVVETAEELGIETLTPRELEELNQISYQKGE